ncbi:MAG TPA: thiol reductant ABC exporter subunit CydC [Candidatus Nanopelagicaceae bacterium]|nr:thiol reductant ABC exporter subunit CydC [Candidatus Nanopelagicaceae bacterium]
MQSSKTPRSNTRTANVIRASIRPFLGRIALGGLLGGLSLGSAVGLMATSAWLISMASTQPPILTLEVAIVAVRFFGLSRGILRYGERLLSHDAVFRTLTRLRVFVYSQLERLSPAALPIFRRGELLNRVVNDVETVQDLWLRVVIPWVSAMVSALCGIGIVAWLAPSAGAFLSVTVILALAGVPLLSWILAGDSARRTLEIDSRMSGDITALCDSLFESIAYGQEESTMRRFGEAHAELLRNESKTARGAGVGGFLVILLTGISLVGCTVIALNSYSAGTLAGINVGVIVLLPLAIFEGIALLPGGGATFGKVLGAQRNIESIMEVEPAESTGTAKSFELGKNNRLATTSFQASWKFGEPSRLKPLAVAVSTGEVLLIQGPSGIGKSTLAYAMAGLTPYEGSIQLNGKEVREIDQNSLTQSVLYGLQESHLFATSIRENLRIADQEARDDDLMRVLRLVEMDDLVRALSDGLDTHIGQFGYDFSGGERQRLALARNLLSKAPVVILDEPTEHLDTDQAGRIEASLVSEFRDRILIVISHRNWLHANYRVTLVNGE